MLSKTITKNLRFARLLRPIVSQARPFSAEATEAPTKTYTPEQIEKASNAWKVEYDDQVHKF